MSTLASALAIALFLGVLPSCSRQAQPDDWTRDAEGPHEPALGGGPEMACATDAVAPFLELARADDFIPTLPDAAETRATLCACVERILGTSTTCSDAWTLTTRALAASSDPRTSPALITWVSSETTRPEHRGLALKELACHPRPAHLEAVRRILASAAMAPEVTTAAPVGLLGASFGSELARASTYALALRVAAQIDDEGARAFLRQLAMDRSRSAPVPATREHLGGCGGPRFHPDEADALASVRVLALSFLGDRELLAAVARDPSEDPMVAHVARGMAEVDPAGARRRDLPRRSTDEPRLAFSPCSF